MNDNDPRKCERALHDLRRWAESDQTRRALEAMELLDLTDEDVEQVFRAVPRPARPRRGVVRVIHGGRVT